MSTTATTSDWARNRRVSWLWPAAFGVVGAGWLVVPHPWGAVLAAAGFAVAGALCVGNNLRCQRTHCAITGPLYLVAALLFLARAGGVSVPAIQDHWAGLAVRIGPPVPFRGRIAPPDSPRRARRGQPPAS